MSNNENGPMMSIFDVPITCDICGEYQMDGEEGEDWNGETGCHKSCELAHQRFSEAVENTVAYMLDEGLIKETDNGS